MRPRLHQPSDCIDFVIKMQPSGVYISAPNGYPQPADAQNRYVFEDFRNRGLADLRENATLYETRMGIQFEF